MKNTIDTTKLTDNTLSSNAFFSVNKVMLRYLGNAEAAILLPEFIYSDLNVNIAKKQIKRDIMLKNAVSNPKLNIVPNIEPDTKTQYRDPISVPNIEPETSGMVDGRWDMGDDKMGDEKMMYEYMGEDDDGFPTIKLPVSQSSRRRSEEFDKIFEENWD